MAIRRARTIDDLYATAKDYDLVLTVEAPLSLALNRRLESAHLGHFATTPRILASGHFRPRDDRELFTQLIVEKNLSWKHAAHIVENVLSYWRETGSLEAILTYDQYDTPAVRAALEVIKRSDSSYRDLVEFTLDAERSIAVIGEDHFTALDR